MTQAIACPDRVQLQQFLLGCVPVPLADQLEAHLRECSSCTNLLASLDIRDPELEGVGAYSALHLSGVDRLAVEDLIQRIKCLKVPDVEREHDASTVEFSLGLPSTDETIDPVLTQPGPTAEITSLFGPAEQSDEIGRLGSYRILKILGVGGMGVVFQAEDTQLHRMVALKVMRPALGKDAFYRERFLREARSLAALEHDHIVPIFQVDEDQGVLFLAMPLLKGETLEQRLARVPFLGWTEILRLTTEIAHGLAAAHAVGLLHRDIKPSNLWMEAGTDRIKLLDFGLAQKANEQGLERQTIAGTPAYMSPEQARSQPLDGRSDLFSLGCVLYRLCATKPAFNSPDKLSLLLSVVADQPRPVTEQRPDCPPPLAVLVMKLLAKAPQDRPASALEVAERAQKIRIDLIQAPRRRRAKALAAAVLLVCASWFALVWGPRVYLLVTNQALVTLESEEQTVTVLVKQNDEVIARLQPRFLAQIFVPAGTVELEIPGNPDGLQLAEQNLVLVGGNQAKAIVRRVPLVRGQLLLDTDDEPLKISLHRGDTQVAALDLPSVGAVELPVGDYDVRLVNQPQTLRAFPNRVTIGPGEKTKVRLSSVGEFSCITDPGAAVNSVAVDAHGKMLLAGMADRAVGLWSLPAGTERFYAKKHASPVTCVALSSDGIRAVTGSGEKGPKSDAAIRVWDVPSGKMLDQLDSVGHTIAGVAMTSDAKIAYAAAGNNVFMWNLDEKKRARTWIAHETGIHCLALLPNGKHLVTGGSEGQVFLWDLRDLKIARSFVGHDRPVRSVAVCADGTQLATASWDGTVRCYDVTNGKELHCFRGHQGWVNCVAISADGKRILSGGADKTVRLWDVDRGREVLRLDGHTASVTCVTFLPGCLQAVSGGKDRQIRLWKLP